MKNLNLVLLLVFSGCGKIFSTKYYDIYIEKYLHAHVDNQSGRDVKMGFCTTESRVVSKKETVPAHNRNFESSTFVSTRLAGKADHPQIYQLKDNTKDIFASVSEDDFTSVKICSSSNYFIIVDLANSCPSGYEVMEPYQVPCSLNP